MTGQPLGLATEGRTAAEDQAQTGRSYLRGAVTLIEHAAVLLAHVPDDELEAVPRLLDRVEDALGYLRRGAAPVTRPASTSAHAPAPSAKPEGVLW